MTGNGWEEMKRLVEYRLDKIEARMDEAAKERAEIRKEVSEIKSKGGAWGALAGFLSGLGVYFGGKFL